MLNFQVPYLKKYKQGFTLLEMAVVIVIIGLAMAMLIPTTRGMRDAENRTLVQKKLDALDTAMANFVAANRRLPCPANGTIASNAANAGVESPFPATGTCNAASQIFGVVPWVTLGLTEEEATDPWLGRMTYRVDPALTQIAPRLMDMSNCDPSSVAGGVGAGNSCKTPIPPCGGNAGCTSPSEFLLNKGLDVWDGLNGNAGWAARQNNRSNGTGAAYVIISHGPTGSGAYNKNGSVSPFNTQTGTLAIPNPPGPAETGGTNEQLNYNGKAIVLSDQNNSYRTSPLNDVVSLVHFDDYLSHPTIMSVLNKANLGPRVH
jgi:prepilin-type N-terminal cleavage/methylation domain-containing protein